MSILINHYWEFSSDFQTNKVRPSFNIWLIGSLSVKNRQPAASRFFNSKISLPVFFYQCPGRFSIQVMRRTFSQIYGNTPPATVSTTTRNFKIYFKMTFWHQEKLWRTSVEYLLYSYTSESSFKDVFVSVDIV